MWVKAKLLYSSCKSRITTVSKRVIGKIYFSEFTAMIECFIIYIFQCFGKVDFFQILAVHKRIVTYGRKVGGENDFFQSHTVLKYIFGNYDVTLFHFILNAPLVLK